MKLAIIGSAPSSIGLAPFSDPEYKILACSPGVYPQLPRCDAFFELHRFEPGVVGKPSTQKPWFSPEYVAWMGMQKLVWMYDVVPQIPGSRRLPVEDLEAKYGTFFFTSSIAWMMACAIEDILEERAQRRADGLDPLQDVIGLWGVDMSACTSYDTKVLTADLRWVTADTLKVGDKLIGFDEEVTPGVGGAFGKRVWRTSEVLEASRITKPCYRVYLEDGREIVCSDEHKWLTHGENHSQWKMTKDLVTPHHRPDRPTRIIKLCDTWVEDKSWEAGYLAAAFDGEGHLSQKLRDSDNGVLRAGFAQRDNVMSDMVLEAMHDRGFDLTVDSEHGGMNGNCLKYTVKGGRVANMEFLGRIRPHRLLEKFNPDLLGIMQKAGTVAVVKIEFIGEQPVIGLRTSTKTFVAEGLATHNTEEYGYQRAGCQHFALLAADLGIQVIVPPESDLLRPQPRYGIDESSHWMIKCTVRKAELSNRLAAAQQREAATTREICFLQGALDDLDYMSKTWCGEREGKGTSYEIMAQSPMLRQAVLGAPAVDVQPQASYSLDAIDTTAEDAVRHRAKSSPIRLMG